MSLCAGLRWGLRSPRAARGGCRMPVRAGPGRGEGWQAQLSGPTLIELIVAAPRGRRNAGRPRFSRRGEAPARPNH